MKYFAQKNSSWGTVHGYEHGENSNLVYEVTSKYALELYKHQSKPGQYNLVAVPNYKKGTRVSGMGYTIWGEIITNAECFNRRLKGNLAQKVLNKRIADE